MQMTEQTVQQLRNRQKARHTFLDDSTALNLARLLKVRRMNEEYRSVSNSSEEVEGTYQWCNFQIKALLAID